jgi:magnesium-transporting ATPase (P-type)
MLVKVEKDGKLPVDMLLLTSTNDDGVVFVDTANLDGETNLKDKMEPIANWTEEKALAMKGKLFCDKPNHVLDEWDAEIISPSLEKSVICDIKNLMLRDTILKNTNYIVGIAINLGKETKIMMNSKKPKSKVSNMMRTMNKLLYSVFGF